jgi:hypothetical protein
MYRNESKNQIEMAENIDSSTTLIAKWSTLIKQIEEANGK